MNPLFIVLFLTTSLTLAKIQQLQAGSNIVMYWGQDSAGSEPSLATFCSNTRYDVINLSFMISFFDTRQPTCRIKDAPDLNFANHGDLCSTWSDCPFMLNCASTIGVDIRNCQSKGIKVVLSLGGAVGSYGFSSDAQATQFAGLLWDMVFEGNSSLRPFGEAVLDGVDLDIEGGSTTGYPTFVKAIRSRMQVSNKNYIISGAPQCPYPDAYLGPAPGKALDDAGSSFSYASVQFYNNYCGVSSISEFWKSFEQWHSTAVQSGYQVMVGLPAAPAAGGGYVDANTICGLVPKLKTYANFGGFMFWDASWDLKNNYYSQQIRRCLV